MMWLKLAFRSRLKHVNSQIFALMIVTVTLPLLAISVIIYIVSAQAVKGEYQSSSGLILNNLSFNIDQYLQSIEQGTVYAYMDGQLQNALEQWEQHPEEDQRIQYQNQIEHFVSTIEMTIKNVNSVQIYAGDRVFYSANFNQSDYDNGSFASEEWYRQTVQRKGGVVIFGTHTPFHRRNSQELVISIARVINKVGSNQPLGVMLVDIRLDSLAEILKLSENSKRNFIIMDAKGGVIYSSDRVHTDGANLAQVLEPSSGSFYAPLAGVNCYINYVTSAYSGWKVVQYIDEREMTKNADLLREIVLALAVCSVGTAVLFMVMLSARVTKPIIQLSRQVKLVGLGKFDNLQLSSNREDEFGVLFQGLRKMVQELQNYIERSSLAKAQQKVAQFGALKSQINPHFLANALESIQMKAVIGGQRDIGEMVGILGRLFRIHIQTGKETVPLHEELSHIRLYVRVQQMRFGDKIAYAEHIAPGCEQLHVMHFSLQPLVENAVIHGLEKRSGPGRLEVAAEAAGDELLVTVRDDGAGMTEEQLHELWLRLAQPSDTLDAAHIGIKNVHDRIQFYFGDKYGVEVDSVHGEGTTVTLRVPAVK